MILTNWIVSAIIFVDQFFLDVKVSEKKDHIESSIFILTTFLKWLLKIKSAEHNRIYEDALKISIQYGFFSSLTYTAFGKKL